jgi:hypothetical protein
VAHETPAHLALSQGRPSSIWPHSRAIVSTMRTVFVIFILALITVAGEIYSDAVLTTGQIAPAASDPAMAAVGRAVKPG